MHQGTSVISLQGYRGQIDKNDLQITDYTNKNVFLFGISPNLF